MLSISFWLQKELQENPKETRWVVSFLLIFTILIAVVSNLNNPSSDDINDESFFIPYELLWLKLCYLWFFLQLLDNMVDTCPHRNHCWHHMSLLHVRPQVLLSVGIPNPSHSYHLEAFKSNQSSSHWAHTVRSVCLLSNKRRKS